MSRQSNGRTILVLNQEITRPTANEQSGTGIQASIVGPASCCLTRWPRVGNVRLEPSQCGSTVVPGKGRKPVGGHSIYRHGSRPMEPRLLAGIAFLHRSSSGAWRESESAIQRDRIPTRLFGGFSNGPRVHQSIRHTVKERIRESQRNQYLGIPLCQRRNQGERGRPGVRPRVRPFAGVEV